jgi:AraC-like DNA-binding protein
MRQVNMRDNRMPKTARATILQDFDQLVFELGGDPDKIFQQADITRAQLTKPDTPISVATIKQVLNLSAQETGCDHFGLELAKRRDMTSYLGVLGAICLAAPTLGEGITKVFSLMRLHSEASLWQLQQTGEKCYVIFSLLDESPGGNKQTQQLVTTLFWRFMHIISEHRWHPTMLSYTFTKPQDLMPYKRTFDVPIDFEADSCGVVFHSADLNIKLPQHDANLHQNLYQHAQAINDSKPRDFKEEIRVLIRKNLEVQQIGEEHITRFFPFERRTLQRKLKTEGTSYRELLNEVRISMAKEIMANSNIPITRLSDRLCFCDLANFTKSFKQYTGMTPRDWRQKIKPNSC